MTMLKIKLWTNKSETIVLSSSENKIKHQSFSSQNIVSILRGGYNYL
jgi:hypothetical protein